MIDPKNPTPEQQPSESLAADQPSPLSARQRPGKRSVSTRLFANLTGARVLLYAAVGVGLIAAALFALQAILLSAVVAGVFLDSQTLADVLPLLGLLLALLLVRMAAVWTGDVLAQQAATASRPACASSFWSGW